MESKTKSIYRNAPGTTVVPNGVQTKVPLQVTIADPIGFGDQNVSNEFWPPESVYLMMGQVMVSLVNAGDAEIMLYVKQSSGPGLIENFNTSYYTLNSPAGFTSYQTLPFTWYVNQSVPVSVTVEIVSIHPTGTVTLIHENSLLFVQTLGN